MDAEPLTDEDRDYCAKWCAARGKQPHLPKGVRSKWHWATEAAWENIGVYDFPEHSLPHVVYYALAVDTDREWDTEAAALDALALALREVRAAAAIPSQGDPDAD